MANFTPQQIEQFLREFFDVVGTRQYTGARYVPIFGRAGSDTVEWDDLEPYEPLTVVMHEGVSYVSRRYVPRGIQVTDTDYWVETYRFNAQVEQYRQEVLSFQGQIDEIREDYVPFPDPDTYPKYGQLGQVLTTLTDGATMWDDPVHVTADIAEPLIEQWLDEHPEATTTVEDGSITDAKMNAGSFYSKVFMPRTIPSGTTLLRTIKTDGTYQIANVASYSDKPTDLSSGTATLVVLADVLAGLFSYQFLITSQVSMWVRVIHNSDNDSVYYDWHKYLSAAEQQNLNDHALRNRSVPSGTTNFYQLDKMGIYLLTNAQSYGDKPAGLTSNYVTAITYAPAFNGNWLIQYVYQSDRRIFARFYDTEQHSGSWFEMPTDMSVTYGNKQRVASGLLSGMVESGSYHNLFRSDYTDWPRSSSNSGTLFVIGTAFNGSYAIQLFVTTSLEVWVRVVDKSSGTIYADWCCISNSSTVTDQTLVGKKWAVCGDSFSYGDFTGYAGDDATLDYGKYSGRNAVYSYIIGNRTNVDVRMFAQNGMTLAYPQDASTTNAFTNTNQPYNYTALGDVDYITLYFGINDSHQSAHIPLGTISDATVNTFYGAYNTVLEYLIENHPNAHIGIIATNGADTDDYRQATIAIANKWGIPYIDLNGDERTPMMLRSTNPNVTSAAKAARTAAWRVSSSNAHPNPAAHRYESLFIESFLKSI